MAWQSVRVLDGDLPVGYTENDYYFTGNRSASHSGSQGGFSDITFVLSFSLRDSSGSAGDSYFYNQPAGDYYLVGDSNAGIFVRKTGGAQSNSGQITVKASYNGQADSGSSMPENLSAQTTIRSGYSGLYMQFSIICGIDEETHKGTIFTYRKWNGWMGSNADYQIRYCDYGRYTNSEIAYNLIKGIMPVLGIASNGGGATHIAKITGQLSSLSNNLSDILMVSGGGGGGFLSGETEYTGKEAGGISGSGDNSADQSTGNAFGQGESGTNVSGGGSGLYGGYKGTSSKSGGAGSGYIGNSLLSNKKMIGYNVPTSSAESTKTESVNEVSASAVSGKPKSGNGFVRIKFLRAMWGGEEVPILWVGNSNKMTVQISNNKIVFKLYSGDLLTYSFDAYAGTTITDADNIYVHFLIESEQELAKPSMIYDNNSVLSYNQEEPSDEEMADIYAWLSAGLS